MAHTISTNWGSTTFWGPDGAAAFAVADTSQIRISVLGGREIMFDLPRQNYEADRLIAMLDSAFASGIEAGKAEVRKALGIKP